jgi:hypothetical protein
MSEPDREELVTGRLQAHGSAPYQFNAGASSSYYLKILTNQGERTLWGQDLKRAIEKAVTAPQIGDVVGARRVGRDAVTILPRKNSRDAVPQPAYRNRWVVEKVEFLAERAKLARRVRAHHEDVRAAVKRSPELLSTFLTLRGAEEIAARRIADPHDRERFVALVKEAMAKSVERGEPLPVVELRDQTKEPAPRDPPHGRVPRDREPTR